MIIQAVTDSFRVEVLLGIHNLVSNSIYMALYVDSPSLNLSNQTTAYSSTGELVASGYTAGGQLLTGGTVNGAPGMSWMTWNSPSWSIPNGTGVSGALVYNQTEQNRSVLVLNFGILRYPEAGVFTVSFSPTTAFPTSPAFTSPLALS